MFFSREAGVGKLLIITTLIVAPVLLASIGVDVYQRGKCESLCESNGYPHCSYVPLKKKLISFNGHCYCKTEQENNAKAFTLGKEFKLQ